MKKYLLIVIVTVFFGASIVSAFENNENRITEKKLISMIDELDQQQTKCDELEIPVGYIEQANIKHAQSFTPQKSILTRASIFCGRVGQPYPFDFSIRKELTGEDLTAISLNYNNFPPEEWGWVEFNFDDIPVIAGEKYFMVMSTQTKTNTIYWICGGLYDPYPFGEVWSCVDGVNWDDDFLPGVDLCFKTYGYGNSPNKPSTPAGPVNGVVGTSYTYSSFTSDPDGDEIYYLFDWGDGTDSGWVGPFNSGDTGSASHKWNFLGTYNLKVKAKDVYDAESVWSDPLSVTIPRNKAIASNMLLLRLLERFPLLQKLPLLIK